MPITLLKDMLVPDVWVPYVTEKTAEKSALFRSGIIATDPRIDKQLNGGGVLIQMPFFKDLQGRSQVRKSDTAIEVTGIQTAKDVARLIGRAQAWGVEDLAAELSGADPMGAIGELVADYWARELQYTLIAVMDGVFANNVLNNDGDLVHDVAIEDGANADEANLISGSVILDAKQKLGDAKDALTAIVMHSQLHTNLQKLNLINDDPEHSANVGWGTYMGISVIVDDGVPVEDGDTSGKKYTSYLFGRGAIGYGEGPVKVPVEFDRDSLMDTDILISRKNFLMHPRGIKWTETAVVGEFPTDLELANPANWERVYEKKNMRFVKLVTNG